MPWFGGGGSGGGFPYKGSVTLFGDLPSSTGSGDFYFVEEPKNSLWVKNPRGFYEDSATGWVNATLKVQACMDSGTIINWDNWNAYITVSNGISIGDIVIYKTVIYANITGAETSTSPDTDTTNWILYNTLQEAYKSGKTITTSNGSVEFKEGTGTDTERVILVRNNADDITASIRGDGTVAGLIGTFANLSSDDFTTGNATVAGELSTTKALIGTGCILDPTSALTVCPEQSLIDYYEVASGTVPAVNGNYLNLGQTYNGYPVYEQDGGLYFLFAAANVPAGAAFAWAVSLDLTDLYNFSVLFQQSLVNLADPTNEFYVNPLNQGQTATVQLITGTNNAINCKGDMVLTGAITTPSGNVRLETNLIDGDEGFNVNGGELSVGRLGAGHELVVGEGDSYPVGLFGGVAFHYDEANRVGDTITGATDITTIWGSSDASSTGLFGGISQGSCALIGAEYPFTGMKVIGDADGSFNTTDWTIASLDSPLIWKDNTIMVTGSVFPYNQQARELGTYTTEQWRIGFDPLLPSTWQKVTLNINGSPITKYWGRMCLETGITADLTVEQIKIHTNRTELNKDGAIEYFGLARRPATFRSGLAVATPNALYDPVNETVLYGADFHAKYIDNEFNQNAKDGFGFVSGVDIGQDTSIPLVVTVSYYVKGTATGDIEFNLDVFQVGDGFTYTGTEIPDSYTDIVTVATPMNRERQTVKFTVNADYVKPAEALVFSLTRDATIGNTNDTLTDNVVITYISVNGYTWRG